MTIGEIYFNCSANHYGTCKLLKTWRSRYGVMYLFGHYGDDGIIDKTYAANEKEVRQHVEGAYDIY